MLVVNHEDELAAFICGEVGNLIGHTRSPAHTLRKRGDGMLHSRAHMYTCILEQHRRNPGVSLHVCTFAPSHVHVHGDMPGAKQCVRITAAYMHQDRAASITIFVLANITIDLLIHYSFASMRTCLQTSRHGC